MEVACTTTGFRAWARARITAGATRKHRSRLIFPLLSLLFGTSLPISAADTFRLPTANQAIYEAGHEDKFFAPTPGKTWISGTFGCVRTEGWQLHEGLDIKCLQRDRHNEPTDSVMATADGTVAYVNT